MGLVNFNDINIIQCCDANLCAMLLRYRRVESLTSHQSATQCEKRGNSFEETKDPSSDLLDLWFYILISRIHVLRAWAQMACSKALGPDFFFF